MNRPELRTAERARRWSRLDRLFEEGRRVPEADRDAFLDKACGPDAELRAELASLLVHATGGGTLLSSLAASLFSPETSSDEAPLPDGLLGRTLHQYRIEARVGGGGMGVVYRARDVRLGRQVALKFIWPFLRGHEEAKERFLVEARAAAAIDHPNICTVHEVGEVGDGTLFIAMAYYEGETLKKRLARGPLPLAEALDAVIQTAEGVAAAHACGVVHHDIKPGNVLVTREGVVKLLDFGVATTGEGPFAGAGAARGTREYMAPERLQGGPEDHRSDVWSLGVMLHELLTGEHPVGRDGAFQPAERRGQEETPSRAGPRPHVPPPIQAVIRRALATDARARHQSARELLDELREANAGGADGDRVAGAGRRGAPTDPPDPGSHASRRRPSPLGAAFRVAAVVAVAVWGLHLWGRGALGEGDAPGPLGPALPPWGSAPAGEASRPGPISLGVLPFENLSPDGDRAWLADGIAGEIRGQLSGIDGLHLASLQSSLVLRRRGIGEDRAGDSLRVNHLLTGSVRSVGDSVWVIGRLFEPRSGRERWTGTYAGVYTASALRGFQADMVHQVTRALDLGPRLEGDARSALPDDAAYHAYLEGRYHLRRFQAGVSWDPDELLRSIEYLSETVRLSPGWAQGWAVLGEAHHSRAFYVAVDVEFHHATSKEALARALELDPWNGLAHASMAWVLHRWDRDFHGAERHFQRALALDPDQYWHCGHAYFLLWAGRYDEAVDAYRRARAHDPLFLPIESLLTTSYLCTGRWDEVLDQAEHTLRVDPESVTARRDLVLALDWAGRRDEAFLRIDEAPEKLPYWDLVRALLHARAGRRLEAIALLDALGDGPTEGWPLGPAPSRRASPPALLAVVLVALGERDAAVQILEDAIDRDPWVLFYDRCYPELAKLESDPRYREVLRRTGLPDR